MRLTSTLLLQIPGIQHGFTAIDACLPEGLLRCHQVHGSNVLMVDGNRACSEDADGLITERYEPVGIVTADCLPLLIADGSGKRVAAVHAGLCGLQLGILYKIIEAMVYAGSNVEHLTIAIGPGIRACCYEVGTEVTDELQSTFGRLWQKRPPPWTVAQPKHHTSLRSPASARNNGVWLNLYALARLQLASCGVMRHQIECVGECTYCGSGAFASFRRNTHEKKPNQSQYSWIARVPT